MQRTNTIAYRPGRKKKSRQSSVVSQQFGTRNPESVIIKNYFTNFHEDVQSIDNNPQRFEIHFTVFERGFFVIDK